MVASRDNSLLARTHSSIGIQCPDLLPNLAEGLLALVDQRSGVRTVETIQLIELQLQHDEKL